MVVNSEYKANAIDYVTCLLGESQEDVGLGLISDGLVLAELRKEKRLNKLVATYKNAQEKAKSARVSKNEFFFFFFLTKLFFFFFFSKCKIIYLLELIF